MLLALVIFGTQLMNDWRLKHWSELPFEPITALGLKYEILASGGSIVSGSNDGDCYFKFYHLLDMWLPNFDEDIKRINEIKIQGAVLGENSNSRVLEFLSVKESNHISVSMESGPYCNYFDSRCGY